MREALLVLVLVLGLTNFSYGQIKKVEVSSEEINTLGRITYGSSLNNKFTKEEIEKYNITQTLAYLLEYIYEDKVIHRDILSIQNLVLSKDVEIRVSVRSLPCFKLSSIPEDVSFSLIKSNNWGVRNSEKGECLCYKPTGMFNSGIQIFLSQDYKKYDLVNLVDGKITLKLYRLEE